MSPIAEEATGRAVAERTPAPGPGQLPRLARSFAAQPASAWRAPALRSSGVEASVRVVRMRVARLVGAVGGVEVFAESLGRAGIDGLAPAISMGCPSVQKRPGL